MNRAQRVIAFLEQTPTRWIPATAFEAVGGRQAWRTAISEARQLLKRDGKDIENRTRTVKRGDQTWTISEYRLVLPQDVPASAPHDLNEFALRS